MRKRAERPYGGSSAEGRTMRLNEIADNPGARKGRMRVGRVDDVSAGLCEA